jgi:capsular exopolysaccharide synthesis family protein
MSDVILRRDEPHAGSLHLSDYWRVLVRRRLLALLVLLLVVGAVAAWVVLKRPVYEATAQIMIEREIPSVLEFERNGQGGAAAEAWDDFYQTQYRLLQSRLLARKVVERLHLLQDPEFGGPRSTAEVQAAEKATAGISPDMEAAIDAFLTRLKIQPVKNSQLVAVTFSAHRPDLAAEAANTLAQVYIQQTLEFRYRVSAEAGAWLSDEAKEQAHKVEAAEAALQKFKEKEGLVSIDERRVLLEQKLKDLGAALTVARTRRLEKEAQFQKMQAAPNPEELPEAISSPLIQGLRTQLAELERQKTQLEAQGYLSRHPEMVKITTQIDGTREKIATEAGRTVRAAENEYRVAAEQEDKIAGAVEGAKAESLDLAQRGLKYDALKRDLQASQSLSDNLVAREKQTDVARDLQASNVHVIDTAIAPTEPVRPRPVRDLGLAVVLGFVLAIGAAFFRDYLDTSVGRPSDVRRLGIPLLGVIPDTTRKALLLGGGDGGRKEPLFAEGYRVLRTSLQDPVEGGRGEVLLVTSALAGEGKSLTAANLALTLASSEERVLLLDADLRRPVLHTLVQGRRSPGLVEVLTGAATPKQAIQRVCGGRLDLLACGAEVARNPADLLSTGTLRELIERLRANYDRIVLDTPPAGSIADALVLSRHADGVIVVARAGKVTRNELYHLLERLANARAPLMGIVLNGARPDRDRYDYAPGVVPEVFGAGRQASLALAEARLDPGRQR